MSKHISLDELIVRLKKLKKKHGGDIPVDGIYKKKILYETPRVIERWETEKGSGRLVKRKRVFLQ